MFFFAFATVEFGEKKKSEAFQSPNVGNSAILGDLFGIVI